MSTIPAISSLQTKNICRCCLVNLCYKNISVEYYFSGQKEVYEDILRDTFNVEIKNYDYYNRQICEDCIVRLRDAHSFKQMVVQSEKKVEMYLYGIESNGTIEQKLSGDLKIEIIKEEFDLNPDVGLVADENSDDEILAKLITDSQRRVQKKVKKRLKDKNTEKQKKKSSEKDLLKIIKHRGKGPVLRENSLKLILNSTICPFQWHSSQYRCFCCKRPFSDMATLKRHTDSEHKLENIEKEIIQRQNCLVKVEISDIFCKICGNQIEDLNSLRTHLVGHNIKFDLQEDLLVPFKINLDNLQCQICSQSFSTFRHLNIHINKHFQKQVCHICGAGFTNSKFLSLHKIRLHRPLHCKECNLKFNNKVDKKNHDVTVHNVIIKRKHRFPCPMCPERFLQENLRVKHLVDKHDMKQPEHKCGICQKVYITKSLINNHMKNVHLKERNHECDVCHHLFYTKSDLVRHQVTHSGVKKFSCNICNNVFASKDCKTALEENSCCCVNKDWRNGNSSLIYSCLILFLRILLIL